MPMESADRYERIRRSLLHVSLRQLTEEPGPDQRKNFARRRARFKRHQKELAEYRASQNIARVAAQERADGELRARLNGSNNRLVPAHPRHSTSHTTSQTLQSGVSSNGTRRVPYESNPDTVKASQKARPPSHHAQRRLSNGRFGRKVSDSTMSSGSPLPRTKQHADRSSHDMTPNTPKNTQSHLVDRTRIRRLSDTSLPTSTTTRLPSSDTVSGDTSPFDRYATRQNKQAASARDLSESPLFMTSHSGRPSTRASARTASQDRAGSIASGPISSTPGTSTSSSHVPGDHSRSGQDQGAVPASTDDTPVAPNHGCTSKHFRIRRIIGRQSIDGDTYYVVSWKSSWVPSDLVRTGDDGQEHCINIDGRDWLIAKTIKHKVKKGTPKQLVQWVDDTLEPVRRLRRALPAIEEFELKPLLARHIVTFDESLLDRATILPQSAEDFREAQVHIARRWPMIAPRNDIDLLPAFRQIMLERNPRPEDNMSSRKTHQQLLDRPQVRPLRWNEEYLLSGRFYDCSTRPRCNALLFQVVADDESDGHCERCVTDTAPFRGCLRDGSDESPWFNGACVNCGAFEMNSTCAHHRVGVAHLERGRSNGLKSERLREFIDPSRSIARFQNLDYEKDDDSDTYSADSYADSDTSSVGDPTNASDDHFTDFVNNFGEQDEESTDNNFQIEDARSEEIEDLHDQRSPETASNQRRCASGTNTFQSSDSHGTHGGLHMQLRSMRNKVAASSTSASSAGIASPTNTNGGAYDQRTASGTPVTPARLDFSSATLPADCSASRSHLHDTPRFHREGVTPDGVHEHSVNGDTHRDNEPVDTRRSKSNLQDLLITNGNLTQASMTPENRSAVIQSIEESVRRAPPIANIFDEVSSSESPHLPSHTHGRKRAASQPCQHERASNRLTTESSRSSGSASHDSEPAIKSRESVASTSTASHQTSSEKKLDRGSTHNGCRVNRPCVYPDNLSAHSGPLSPVYRDTVDGSHTFTIGEVLFILSHSTCHWASAFTKVWNGWREEGGSPFDAEHGKAQFLLSTFPEHLLQAAKECCPTDPNNRVVITID